MSQLTCEQAVELIMDFLKRELPPEVARAMQDHIEECRPCEQHVMYESRFVLLVGNRLRQERCPETLRAKLMESLFRDNGE